MIVFNYLKYKIYILFYIIIGVIFLTGESLHLTKDHLVWRNVRFSVAIENEEVLHVCSPEHLRMGTEIMKQDRDTQEEGKKGRVNMESTRGTKKNVKFRRPSCSL